MELPSYLSEADSRKHILNEGKWDSFQLGFKLGFLCH